MSKFVYTGDQPQVYPQYLDAEKGSTLAAEPEGVYDIRVAEGQPDLPLPPDARWTKPSTRPAGATEGKH